MKMLNECPICPTVRPINVSIIIGSEEALRVHTNVGLICRSYGSIPRPQIVWLKNRKLIQDGIEYEFQADLVWFCFSNAPFFDSFQNPFQPHHK